MELFSEIYSCYFNVVGKILNLALENNMLKNEINEVVEENAFSESVLYILPRLIEGTWDLLNNSGNGYESKIQTEVKRPITLLEKSWIKALMEDKRITLFLKDEQIEFLKGYLKDVEPLFDIKDFYYYDTFSDGDDYENKEYIKNFRQILNAVKNKRIITISFESGKGARITGNYLPYRIEYSNKDDKFRVHVIRLRYSKVILAATINIARITKIEPSKEMLNIELNFNKYIDQDKCKNPVVIEISKERNALERCMLHFANFEKHTEYDEKNDRYLSYIYYDKKDEIELLIRILSFGPVIKVIGPESFLKLVRERVKKQVEVMDMI